MCGFLLPPRLEPDVVFDEELLPIPKEMFCGAAKAFAGASKGLVAMPAEAVLLLLLPKVKLPGAAEMLLLALKVKAAAAGVVEAATGAAVEAPNAIPPLLPLLVVVGGPKVKAGCWVDCCDAIPIPPTVALSPNPFAEKAIPKGMEEAAEAAEGEGGGLPLLGLGMPPVSTALL